MQSCHVKKNWDFSTFIVPGNYCSYQTRITLVNRSILIICINFIWDIYIFLHNKYRLYLDDISWFTIITVPTHSGKEMYHGGWWESFHESIYSQAFQIDWYYGALRLKMRLWYSYLDMVVRIQFSKLTVGWWNWHYGALHWQMRR